MGMEDWSLACSWPPMGDQWQYNVDQFFEPLQLLNNKSDEAEYQLFNDDVTVQQNQSFNAASSSGSSRTCVTHLLCSTQIQFFLNSNLLAVLNLRLLHVLLLWSVVT